MAWRKTAADRQKDDRIYRDPEYVRNRAIVMRRANGRCECPGDCGGHEGPCGRRDRRIQCDHINPASKGADHSLANLRGLCSGPGSCHARKSAAEGGPARQRGDPDFTPRTKW